MAVQEDTRRWAEGNPSVAESLIYRHKVPRNAGITRWDGIGAAGSGATTG